jgi:hypothetical protein
LSGGSSEAGDSAIPVFVCHGTVLGALLSNEYSFSESGTGRLQLLRSSLMRASQGCQMNNNLGGVPVPVSAIQMFNTLGVLVMVPVFDNYIYPTLDDRGVSLTLLKKMGTVQHYFQTIYYLI